MEYQLHTPKYQLLRLKIRFKLSEYFRFALKNNVTPMVCDFVKNRCINYKQNVIISIFGETGFGKSYVAFRMCEYIKKLQKKYLNRNIPFDENHIFIDMSEMNDFLQTKIDEEIDMTGWSFVLDEQAEMYGMGSHFEIGKLKNIEMTCRKKQINLFYCSPMVRTHYHNYILECFLTRWVKQNMTVNDKGYIPYGKTYVYVYPHDVGSFTRPLGYMILNHPEGVDYIQRYEKYKDTKIDSYLGGATLDMETIKKKVVTKYFEQPFAQNLTSVGDISEALTSILPSGTSITFLKSIAQRIKLINQGDLPIPVFENATQGHKTINKPKIKKEK